MRIYDYTAVVEFDEEAQRYVGYFPAVRGAVTEADTLEQLRENLKDVLQLVLERRAEKGKPVLKDVFTTERISVTV